MLNRLALLSSVLCLSGCLATQIVPSTTSETTPKQNSKTQWDYFTEVYEIEHDPYPFVGSLHDDNRLIGSGVLIKPNVILSAGHVAEHNPTVFRTTDGVEHCIKEIVFHPEYQPYPSWPKFIEHDMAIIFLEGSATVAPIENYTPGNILQHTPLTTIGYSKGIKKYSNPNTFWYYGRLVEEPEEVIFLPLKATVWFGDSGGAVIAHTGGKSVLIGIISSFAMSGDKIYECAAASTHYYNNWIEEVLNERLEGMVR